MQKLLIATSNLGKIKEFQTLLADLDVQLITPSDIGLFLEVLEDGQNYEENAAKKALAYSKVSEFISLADDSGLEVDALDGAPGLHSARYSSTPQIPQGLGYTSIPGCATASMPSLPASDADRRGRLLKNLIGKPRPWTAHFHATIAIGLPSQSDLLSKSDWDIPLSGNLFFASGDCYGEIIPNECGKNGFGYDPIFFIPEMNCTMAELSMQVKNCVSHRARAVKNILPFLQKVL
jgi:XTP/dITP diphosphohydrolase